MPEWSNGADSRSAGFRLQGFESSPPHSMKAKSRKLYAIICEGCGEKYSLKNFSKNNPLDICGECGCEEFIPYSRDCLTGFRSLEHYVSVLDILPEHLRPTFLFELGPRPSPFRASTRQ